MMEFLRAPRVALRLQLRSLLTLRQLLPGTLRSTGPAAGAESRRIRGSIAGAAFGVFVLATGCGEGPTSPGPAIRLSGRWTANLWQVNQVNPPCDGVWSSVVLSLEQDGDELAGSIVTQDGRTFAVSGSLGTDTRELVVAQTPNEASECTSFTLLIGRVDQDEGGETVRFFGRAHGRCCTVFSFGYRFDRMAE